MNIFRIAVLTALLSAPAHADDIRFDDVETRHWMTINDTVMGGVSNSRFYHEYDYGVFEGVVSLDNNGGFASIRRVISPDFHNGGIVRLIVKGDGRRYQFRLKTDGLYEGAAYVAEFTTKADQWQQIQFTEKDFTPRFRGRYVDGAPALRFGDAIQVGLLIGDKIEGKFKLQVQAIEVLETI
ncbi:CIA30 family protein [Thalassotalea euphylliae]|uniref:CIA30 family protein n=1 Tax=Thalassotalea euphylliae TaxID=1655234 RepID=UPI00362DC124